MKNSALSVDSKAWKQVVENEFLWVVLCYQIVVKLRLQKPPDNFNVPYVVADLKRLLIDQKCKIQTNKQMYNISIKLLKT